MGKEGGVANSLRVSTTWTVRPTVGEGGDGLVDVPAADKQQGVGLDGEV